MPYIQHIRTNIPLYIPCNVNVYTYSRVKLTTRDVCVCLCARRGVFAASCFALCIFLPMCCTHTLSCDCWAIEPHTPHYWRTTMPTTTRLRLYAQVHPSSASRSAVSLFVCGWFVCFGCEYMNKMVMYTYVFVLASKGVCVWLTHILCAAMSVRGNVYFLHAYTDMFGTAPPSYTPRPSYLACLNLTIANT